MNWIYLGLADMSKSIMLHSIMLKVLKIKERLKIEKPIYPQFGKENVSCSISRNWLLLEELIGPLRIKIDGLFGKDSSSFSKKYQEDRVKICF